MNNIVKKVLEATRRLLTRAAAPALAIGLCAFALPAIAQVSIPTKIYPLTNSLTGTNFISITNGSTAFLSSNTYVVSSAPFRIWRGRGFVFNAGFYMTNASGSNVVFTIRFAAVHQSGTNGLYLTNWSAFNPLTMTFPNNGTTETFVWSNIPPTLIDNVDYGQLYSLTNCHTSTLFLDPTNTFISTYP